MNRPKKKKRRKRNGPEPTDIWAKLNYGLKHFEKVNLTSPSEYIAALRKSQGMRRKVGGEKGLFRLMAGS